ncbi:hypothetical protein [Acuticoccus yangtzensis]|uniref:hypothetical protein n=1 Tax=Acuticoccus yangtzensis TaxID=1443441 RepID=UPI0009497283|nr:hypothetical protein [Acuticoccus yangtzensis]
MGEAMDASPPDHHQPGGEPAPQMPRAFATGYKPHSGDMMVYGGGVVTLIGVLAAFVNGTPAFFLLSLAGTFCAFYFRPTLDNRRPQLGADVNGLYVARFGKIPWSRVADIHVEHHALRTMRLATLVIVPKGTIAEAVETPETLRLVERLTARNARAKNGVIRVPLHALAMDPVEVETRLRALRKAAG